MINLAFFITGASLGLGLSTYMYNRLYIQALECLRDSERGFYDQSQPAPPKTDTRVVFRSGKV